MSYLKEYERWLSSSDVIGELREELELIKGNELEIKERFFKPLEFGTAGLRGVIGAGINRMNIFVVANATKGLAEVIKTATEGNKTVVVAYDSRKNSKLFAEMSAMVLAKENIKCYLFESLRPVPELSFAIRHFGATAGIVITASHNPHIYNGYKAYWADGSQLPPQFADVVFEKMNENDILKAIEKIDFEQAIKSGKIEIIGKEIDELFYNEVLKLSICPNLPTKDIKIIYTPFHGAGNVPVRETLKRAGFENVIVVSEQEQPDEKFSTVKSPNPEDKEGFDIAINNYGKKYDGDLIIGTDPDCDRVGIVVKNREGEYICLSGNQVGVLLTHYILNGLKEQNKLPENGAVIKSIVSTKMADDICKSFDIEIMNVLTGFKFIGEKIKEFEATNSHKFLFGFEESYGYLSGTHARDKDGVNAVMLICEMAAYYKNKDMSLIDALEGIYEEYGYFKEKVISITLPGLDGMEKIKSIMKKLREDKIETLNNKKVINKTDYILGEKLPKSDVLSFDLEDGTTIFVRPSGTEPKIKGYIMVKGSNHSDADEKLMIYEEVFKNMM